MKIVPLRIQETCRSPMEIIAKASHCFRSVLFPSTGLFRGLLMTASILPLIVCPFLISIPNAFAQCPEEPPVQNYTGAGMVVCPCFVPGEQAGAVLNVPPDMYPIEILRVGIGWGSQIGGAPQQLEEAIHIYDGGLPNPGSPIFSLPGPQLADGVINVFDLEPLPGEIIIESGPFTVTLEFMNQNAGDPYAPSTVHDGNGCQTGKNVVYAIPGGWYDACDLGVTGDWIFFVVYRSARPPEIASTPESIIFSEVHVNQTSCDTVLVINEGCDTLSIQGIYGCSAAPFSIDTTLTAHSVPPLASTKLLVCTTPVETGPDSCTVTIASNATNGSTVIPVRLDVVTAIEPTASPNVLNILSVVPNPFNPSTTVRFSLTESLPVSVDIWSVDGKQIRTLASDILFPAGENDLQWNGMDSNGETVASGVYFIRVSTPLQKEVTRAVLLK